MKLFYSLCAVTSAALLVPNAGAAPEEASFLRRAEEATQEPETVWCDGVEDPFPSTCDAESYLKLDVMDATGVEVEAILAFRTVLSNFQADILEGAHKDMLDQNLAAIDEANIDNAIVDDDVLLDMFWDELCLVYDDKFCYFGYEALSDSGRRELASGKKKKKKKSKKKKSKKKKKKKKTKKYKKRSRALLEEGHGERTLDEAIITEELILSDSAVARLEYLVLEVAGNLIATVADDAAVGRPITCNDILLGVEETSVNPDFYLDTVVCL